jgi:curved DNA-binding protein CbpA
MAAHAKPTFAGTLRDRPPACLLVAILDDKCEGTLVVEELRGATSVKSAYYFAGGAPAKARTAEPVIYLGRLLVELGKIDEATHDATLQRVAQKRRLHGQILLEQGAVDPSTLRSALQEQLLRRIEWLFSRPPEAMFGFYANTNYLQHWGTPEIVTVPPLVAIWRGVRNGSPIEAVREAVAALGDPLLALHRRCELARFGLGSKEHEVGEVLGARELRLSELLAMGLADEESVLRLVHTLVVTRHFDLGGGDTPCGITLPPPSSAPSSPRRGRRSHVPGHGIPAPSNPMPSDATGEGTANSPAARRELEEEAARLAKCTYYEAFQVAPNAPVETIQRAFFELAKRWHPDRLSPKLSELRPLAEQTFARITEAHQTLVDLKRRHHYDRALEKGGDGDEQQQVMDVLTAAMAFQKAEVLLKKRSYAEAEERAREALRLDPNQADYAALVAWIEALKTTDSVELLRHCRTLDDAVRRDSNNERIRFYRAQLLKRAGKQERALQDFRWIASHNPHHVDAQRELRLHLMRTRRSLRSPPSSRAGTPPSRRSLIDKLLKR